MRLNVGILVLFLSSSVIGFSQENCQAQITFFGKSDGESIKQKELIAAKGLYIFTREDCDYMPKIISYTACFDCDNRGFEIANAGPYLSKQFYTALEEVKAGDTLEFRFIKYVLEEGVVRAAPNIQLLIE